MKNTKTGTIIIKATAQIPPPVDMWWKPVATITLINQKFKKIKNFLKILKFPDVSNNNNSCPVFFFFSIWGIWKSEKRTFQVLVPTSFILCLDLAGVLKKRKTRKRGEKGKQKRNARNQKRDTIKLHLINICLYIYIFQRIMWPATLRPTARKKKKKKEIFNFLFAVELISSYKTAWPFCMRAHLGYDI